MSPPCTLVLFRFGPVPAALSTRQTSAVLTYSQKTYISGNSGNPLLKEPFPWWKYRREAPWSVGKVRQTNQSIGGFRRLDSSKDRHLHGLSGQGTHQIDVTRNRAHGESIDAVSVQRWCEPGEWPWHSRCGPYRQSWSEGFWKIVRW